MFTRTKIVRRELLGPRKGRRGSPRIDGNVRVYAIMYTKHNAYFPYVYLNKIEAMEVQKTLETNADFERVLDWNIKKDIQQCLHVGKL